MVGKLMNWWVRSRLVWNAMTPALMVQAIIAICLTYPMGVLIGLVMG